MKGKHLALLLLLALLIGGAWYSLQQGDDAAGRQSDGAGTKVLDFPINAVERVTVKGGGSELNLVKKGDDWFVQERADYPASYDQVSDFIRKLWELKTVQDVKVGPSQFSRLDLVEPGAAGSPGTLAELKDKDGKPLAALLLGKKYLKKSDGMGMGMPGEMPGFAAGRYVAPLGSSKVSLVSETLEDVDTKAEKWLTKDFFKIELPKTIKLEGTTEPMHWMLTRESATGEWKLSEAKPDEQPLDAAKVSSFGNLLSSASFADVLAPDAKPEDTGLDKPTVVTFTTFDKFTYILKIGKPNGENLPVTVAVSAELAKTREPGKDEKPEDKEKLDREFATTLKRLEDKLAAEKKFEQRPYLIAKSTLDPLLKDRPTLLAEKKPETPPPAAPGATSPAGIPPFPAPSAPAQPAPPKREPITVTTPPVSAPPLPPGIVPPPSPDGKPAAPEPAPKPESGPKPEPSPEPAKPTPPESAKPAPESAKPASEEPAPKPPEPKEN